MVRPSFSLHSLFLSVHAGPDASVSAPRRERASSQTRAHLGRGTSAHRPAFADKYRGTGGCSKSRKIKVGKEAIAPLKGRAFKIEISKVSGSALVAEICTDPHNRLLRRQHCSSLCLQSEGHEHVANMTSAFGHDFVGFSARAWPPQYSPPPHFASKVSYSASPQASAKCPEVWQKEGCEGGYLNLFSYLCVLQAYMHLL